MSSLKNIPVDALFNHRLLNSTNAADTCAGLVEQFGFGIPSGKLNDLIEDIYRRNISRVVDKQKLGNRFFVISPYLLNGWKRMQELLPANIDKDAAWKAGKIVLYTTGVSVVLIGGVYVILPAVGFTPAGVGVKTAAAYWQATLGGTIAPGSLFAALQSVGAAGLAFPTKFLTFTTTAGVMTALRSKL